MRSISRWANKPCAAWAVSAVSTSKSLLNSAVRVERMYGSSSTTNKEQRYLLTEGLLRFAPWATTWSGLWLSEEQYVFSTYSLFSNECQIYGLFIKIRNLRSSG